MVYQLIGRRTLPSDCMLWTKELFWWACVCCFVRPQWFYHSPISRSECNAWLPVTQFRRRVQARTEHEEDIITTLTTLFMLQLGVQRAGPAALHRERQGGLRQVQPPVQQRSREGRSQGENEPFFPANIILQCKIPGRSPRRAKSRIPVRSGRRHAPRSAHSAPFLPPIDHSRYY